MPTDSPGDPWREVKAVGQRPRRRLLRPPRRDDRPVVERQIEEWESWWANRQADIRAAEQQRHRGLRQRKDGSPSAQRPLGVLPVSYWATVQHAPDGDEDDSVPNRLANYEMWLKALKRNGLYDGPTELRSVNRTATAADAEDEVHLRR